MRLILFVANRHGISGDDLDRLVAYLQIQPDGTFFLPLRVCGGLSHREVADAVHRLDRRLVWEEDRWRFP